MTTLVVRLQFTHGAWTYRPGEEWTTEQLAARGLAGSSLEYARWRGNLEDPQAQVTAIHANPMGEILPPEGVGLPPPPFPAPDGD